jgi:SAM-dependent methyltransferase
VINEYQLEGKDLLDMACGTGTHAKLFADKGYNVVGVDVNSEMLKIAKGKTKKIRFVEGSMLTHKSKQKFDVVTCLFTAINYNRDILELKRTIINFSGLLRKGGIVIFDLGLVKGRKDIEAGKLFIDTYAENDLQIARISQWSQSKEKPDVHDAKYLMLIKENGKVDFEIDEHELGVFSVEEVKAILNENGFEVKIYADYCSKKYTKKFRKPIFVGQKR